MPKGFRGFQKGVHRIHTGGVPIAITQEKVDLLEDGKEYSFLDIVSIFGVCEKTLRRRIWNGTLIPSRTTESGKYYFTKESFKLGGTQ